MTLSINVYNEKVVFQSLDRNAVMRMINVHQKKTIPFIPKNLFEVEF